MTKEQFLNTAKAMPLTINGQTVIAEPRIFGGGDASAGWFASGKVMLEVNGERYSVQVGLNMSVVKSKDWEKGNLPAEYNQPKTTKGKGKKDAA